MYPEYISNLIFALRKLPGIGFKTAEKLAFELINWKDSDLTNIANAIQNASTKKSFCKICFCLKDDSEQNCSFCHNPSRDSHLICIVANHKDVFFLEKSKIFKGMYHVLGNLISPITNQSLSESNLSMLKTRLKSESIKEIVITLDATLEGDATALFLKQELKSFPLKISRLALGLPVGLSFDYIDSGTLAKAFSGRHPY